MMVREICFDLPEEVDPQVRVGQSRKHRAKVAHVEDVIHNTEGADSVSLPQCGDLLEHTVRRLASECHRGAIESAERAVGALAPPATPSSLDEQRRRDCARSLAGLKLVEEVVEVWHRHAVHIMNGLAWREFRYPIAGARGHAPNAFHAASFLPRQ